MKCKEDILGRESPCSKQDCRNWIKYKEERLGVSHVRIKQIQDKVLIKLKKNDEMNY